MIQLYLLVLIIIFVVILVTIKETFQSNLKCDSEKQRVIQWSRDNDNEGSYLYGCNSLYNDNKASPSQIGITLFWNKPIGSNKTVLIVNTEDKDDTFIEHINPAPLNINPEEGEDKKTDQNYYSYELKDNIIEGKTYFITVNYIDSDEIIHVSNTLKITAISPVPHFKSSGFKLQQQNLMNLLKNKTFDIYL
jgi:hypothetical protein